MSEILQMLLAVTVAILQLVCAFVFAVVLVLMRFGLGLDLTPSGGATPGGARSNDLARRFTALPSALAIALLR